MIVRDRIPELWDWGVGSVPSWEKISEYPPDPAAFPSFYPWISFLSAGNPPPKKIPFGNFGVGRKIPELGWDWSSFPGIFGIFDVETLPPSEKNPKKKKFPRKLQSRGLGRDFFFPGYPNIFAPDGIFPAIS